MKIKIHIFSIETYFILIVVYYFIISTTYLTRQFFDLNLIRPSLFFLLLINIFFIAGNIKYGLKVNAFFLFLLISFSLSSIYGLINNGLSLRSLTDILKPLNFLFIYIIVSKLPFPNKKVIQKISNRLLYITIIFSVLTIILYLLIGGRVGVILPFAVPLSFAIYNVNILNIVFIVLATFFSGNRASFFVAFFVIFWLFLWNHKKYLFYILFPILFIFIFFNNQILSSSFYKRNIEYTINQSITAIHNKNYLTLDKISSGRISEIVTIFSEFKAADYIFGKGIGFNYQAKKIINNNFDLIPTNKEQSNSHFSPLGLYLSYGILFVFIFYFFIFYYLRIGYLNMKNNFIVYISFYIILFTFLESFFSFQIFNNPFLPIALGWIENYKRNYKVFKDMIKTL